MATSIDGMSSLDCVISVSGGRHGGPTHDQTRPVREFLVDSQVYYSEVLKHIKSCVKCDPFEALKAYLERRRTELKFGGETSSGLVDLALKYEKLIQLRSRKGQDLRELRSVVNEFIWRSGVYVFREHLDRLETREVFLGCRLAIRNKRYDFTVPGSIPPRMRSIWKVAESAARDDLAPEEIEKLMTVVDVMAD